MSLDDLRIELQKIDHAIKVLNDYIALKLVDVPNDIRDSLKQIQFMPEITSTGLESVEGITEHLKLAKTVIKLKLSGDKSATTQVQKEKTNSSKPTIQAQSIPQSKPQPIPKSTESNIPKQQTPVAQSTPKPTPITPQAEEEIKLAKPQQNQDSLLDTAQSNTVSQLDKNPQVDKQKTIDNTQSGVLKVSTDNSNTVKKDPLDPFDN